MNCPVCNKTGLPDYTSEPVICPQCNSDLKGFTTLEKTSMVHRQAIRKQQLSFLIVIFLILTVFGSFVFWPQPQRHEPEIMNDNQDSVIAILKTNLDAKDLEIEKLKDSKQSHFQFNYVVKSGDNLSKIAYMFYGDWEDYKLIMEANNLNPQSVIHPGETLKINLKQN